MSRRRVAGRWTARVTGQLVVAGLNSAVAGAGTAARRIARTVRRAGGRRGRRALLLGLGAPVVMCCCAGGLVLAAAAALFEDERLRQRPTSDICAVPLAAPSPEALASLDDEQWDHARTIVAVGMRSGAPPRAWVVAVATAMQESSLRNLPHLGEDNDHDSLGLFQQRPSQGWGSTEQVLDPEYASAAFYERLRQVDGWQHMPVTDAAQAVQRSAHPHAYAAHEPLAVALVDTLTGGAVTAAGATATAVSAAGDQTCPPWVDAGDHGWTRPADGPMWSGFRTAHRPEHYGVDIGAPRGAVVRSAADGTVTRVRCQASLRGQPYSCDVDGTPAVAGCGWYVDIRHGGDVVTRYCHLLAQPMVTVGQQVAAGQPIGLVGSSGRSSGPHLHFEVERHHLRRDGATVRLERRQTDPVAFLAARGVVLECAGAPADCVPVHGDRIRLS